MLAHGDRKAAQVVEMAVREHQQIEADAGEFGVIGKGGPAGELGVQAAIYENVKVADLEQGATAPDAALTVEVD
jgi:hypothetical protein